MRSIARFQESISRIGSRRIKFAIFILHELVLLISYNLKDRMGAFKKRQRNVSKI